MKHFGPKDGMREEMIQQQKREEEGDERCEEPDVISIDDLHPADADAGQ
jgi:hypothetical protein